MALGSLWGSLLCSRWDPFGAPPPRPLQLRDCELSPGVNRDLTRRVRNVNGLTQHRTVVRNDIKLAARLVHALDARGQLWGGGETDVAAVTAAAANPGEAPMGDGDAAAAAVGAADNAVVGVRWRPRCFRLLPAPLPVVASTSGCGLHHFLLWSPPLPVVSIPSGCFPLVVTPDVPNPPQCPPVLSCRRNPPSSPITPRPPHVPPHSLSPPP